MKELRNGSAHFLTAYRRVPETVRYFVDDSGDRIDAGSSRAFTSSRHKLLSGLLSGEQKNEQLSQSLLAEEIVRLTLRGLVYGTGFKAVSAQQSLEHGNMQKGIDLIMCDSNNLAYLGIDVKLRIGTSARQRDGYGWIPHLRSPFIYLSLGNWHMMQDPVEDMTVKEWLIQHAVPAIKETGKIPCPKEFRSYLIGRIERSINGYMERLSSPELAPERFGIPPTLHEYEILLEKLAILQSLFIDLSYS